MEFLKTCSTNAQAIGDFEAVAYQAFSVKRNAAAPSGTVVGGAEASEILHTVEAEFRQRRQLVVQDAGRSWLWLFRSTTPDRSGQIPTALPVIEGYDFHVELSGIAKASELARAPGRSSNPGTPPSMTAANSPSTPSTHRAAQAGNLRTFQANSQLGLPPSGMEQQPQHDICAIYELFMSSVIAYISFNLVRDHDILPLNYRTFISFPTSHLATHDDLSDVEISAWLTTLDVHWTSAGCVVISTSSFRRPEIHRVTETNGDENQPNSSSRYLRIAPNGILAKLVGFERSPTANHRDGSLHEQRKRTKIGNVGGEIRRWKNLVTRWLQWKGFSLKNFENDETWAKIQVTQDLAPSAANQSSYNPTVSREVLWPSSLCFFYEPYESISGDLRTRSTEPSDNDPQSVLYGAMDRTLNWFKTPDSTGFQDPLDAAQKWFSGKGEREKAQEARRKAQQAEEEAAQAKDESTVLYPSSPLYSRTGAYGDLQTVSGVYPTPPDGVISQGPQVSSNIDVPSISGPIPNLDGVLAQAGFPSAASMAGPMELDQTASHELPGTTPGGPHLFDSQTDMHFDTSLHDASDDLFEDMDEDVFDGNGGVTDADFNFFDEPDGEDLNDMLDTTESDGNGQSADVPVQNKTQTPPSQNHNIKVEPPSDPMSTSGDARQPAIDETIKLKSELGLSSLHEVQAIAERDGAGQPDSKTHILTKPITHDQGHHESVPSPPLSPHLIQQKLLPSPNGDKDSSMSARQVHAKPIRKESIFDPVSFNRKISLSDSKYSDGRFSFAVREAGRVVPSTDKIPKLSLHRSNTLSEAVASNTPTSKRFSLLMHLRGSVEGRYSDTPRPDALVPDEDDNDDGDTSGSSDSDFSSENDSPSSIPEPVLAGITWAGKRKWNVDESATPLSATSLGESKASDENPELALSHSMLQTNDRCLLWFEPSPWDWSLADFPSPTELATSTSRNDPSFISPSWLPRSFTLNSPGDSSAEASEEMPTMSGKDMIAVAQILTDQIITATLDILGDEDSASGASVAKMPTDNEDSLNPSTLVQGTIKQLFSKTLDCDLVKFATIQDLFLDVGQAVKGQPRPVPRRMNTSYSQGDGTGSPGHLIYPIRPPHIRVRRADALWDLLPPAISFWEPLGLAPPSGPKNIIAYCVYPHSEPLKARVESFLENVGIFYESCKLGNHTRTDAITEFQAGLVPTKVSGPATARAALRALRDTCTQLGRALSGSYAEMCEKAENQKIDAFVIYMINPFDKACALGELCSAFWSLFQTYQLSTQGRGNHSAKPDLVLQVVPIKYVASFDAPVVLEPTTLISLAREVYDRCPPNNPSEDKTPLSIYSAPSIQLEETLPRIIHFKLTAELPHDILHENSYIHLGYAISLDNVWITAAWTDSCGKSQAVVSYCVGERAFVDIAREIWQTTIDILQSRRVTWRICIAKAGIMEREEVEAWMSLASSPTQLNLYTTLLTVDISPTLTITPILPSNNSANTSSNAASSTPVSTPQPGVSPDPHGLTPAATPSDLAIDPSADPDARLIDITDESWGIILLHRLHNSHSAVEYRPALISGLLVKRGDCSSTTPPSPTANTSRGPIVIGINIIWVGMTAPRSGTANAFNSTASGDGVSPGGIGLQGNPERSSNGMSWTSTAQSRATAENLLKEVLAQFRGLGLLARLKGMRGTRHGAVPWHVAAALRGVNGVGKCF
ncbi:hypothetical protein K432DRAFT_336116 [Lepidopterella palustris CBS 459.81]|uniref:Mediator of RNA polymerase II transcription subunit 13 n=1 Tax=Lepidopterella palustris CBS 459.81 TaxID=1314670 RepID=A0A8E2JBE9_9PEZI|nr:hypothetical protein K432DRAFT_336116 [Lepidopterella palustris CBS 459.81]